MVSVWMVLSRASIIRTKSESSWSSSVMIGGSSSSSLTVDIPLTALAARTLFDLGGFVDLTTCTVLLSVRYVGGDHLGR